MGVEDWFPQCPHFLLLPQILLLLGHLDPHGLIAFSSNHTLRSVGRKLTTLRAHHIRIVGVVGSNPIRSTKKRTTAVILPWFFFIFLHQKYPLAYSSKQAFQIACLGDIKFLKILFDNIFHNSTKCDTINCNINWMTFPVSGIEKVMIV